ncbi:hypothetical protein WJX74_000493 [Apatococcus lobatus]|uniref:Uncharacterized protein n=1 Tax=Apatococcus lobatus TaxID=904363 RepID=A0AAW1S1T0_9CHLO
MSPLCSIDCRRSSIPRPRLKPTQPAVSVPPLVLHAQGSTCSGKPYPSSWQWKVQRPRGSRGASRCIASCDQGSVSDAHAATRFCTSAGLITGHTNISIAQPTSSLQYAVCMLPEKGLPKAFPGSPRVQSPGRATSRLSSPNGK